ncbi:MAG: DUF2268 domain-containing putative Zn-dependent protease [Desulfobacterales bacterium]|jgi:hypothetical protein
MKRRLVFFVLSLWLLWVAATVAMAIKSSVQVNDSYRVINVVNDFQAYYQKCSKMGWPDRLDHWDTMLEVKYPRFFKDAIYRGKNGIERDRYKQNCIRLFWDEVAPRMVEISHLNRNLEKKINLMVTEFRKQLPDFVPATDFYITISFSFKGKALPFDNRNIIAIGLETFNLGDEQQIYITLAHEMFHLYHFSFFQPGGGLYRLLWAEGLATYASAVVVPGHRRSFYLGFPVEKMNRCYELLPLLAEDLKKNLGRNDHRLKRIYFGAEPNETSVPPEAGYYVGLLILEKLAAQTPLDQLAKMPADKVMPLLAKELAILERNYEN